MDNNNNIVTNNTVANNNNTLTSKYNELEIYSYRRIFDIGDIITFTIDDKYYIYYIIADNEFRYKLVETNYLVSEKEKYDKIDGVEIEHMMISKPMQYNESRGSGNFDNLSTITVINFEIEETLTKDTDPIAIYIIDISIYGHMKHTIRRRFRELAELNDNLSSAYRNNILLSNFPPFPERLSKMVSDHSNEAFIQTRANEISKYLQALLNFPYIRENPDFLKFISQD